MSIETNLQGRLRNTALPMSSGLLPLYEAVANSIHSIEEVTAAVGRGCVTVEIERDGQGSLPLDQGVKRPGPEAKGDIVGFKISDNGVGFDDVNIESFETLDSDHKATRGGRGVGRLLWLKAFDRASIDSVYAVKDGDPRRRTFMFDPIHGVSTPVESEASGEHRKTIVHLLGFAKRYRDVSPKTAQVIARNLLEHCLWYFVRPGGAPKIELIDGDEVISLDDVYDSQMLSSATPESIEIKGTKFELIHIKLSASSSRSHGIAYCASNRLVVRENLRGRIPGLFGSLHDDVGDFVYECYVSSPLLDSRVRSERTSFDIEAEPSGLFANDELSQKEISDAVVARAASFLARYVDETKRLAAERISTFVATKAPRYRPILGRIPTEQLAIDPDLSERELELALHKCLAEIERKLLADGHEVVLMAGKDNYEDYRRRLEEYLKTAEDLKKSDLASYVSHRRVILDLLEKAIQRQPDGAYAREEIIHSLIMPMGRTSDDVHFDACNLWLIDERLAFHDFLASDKPLASLPITDSKSNKEPDLLALSVFDTPVLVADSQCPPLASITIVELKRPMRNDASRGEDKDPVEQALGYLQRIRDGNVTTRSGRPIPQCKSIPGFCYAICDLTPSIVNRCKLLGLTPTHDFAGYFGYNPNFGAYIEVISFDRLLRAARERNRAFFDKLGLPTS